MDQLSVMIGKKIQQYRKKNNITVKELAERINTTPSLISQIEHGKANPSLSTLKAIADAFNVPIGIFFESNAEGTPSPVIRRNTHRRLLTDGNVTYTLLNSDVNDLEVILIEFPPGSSTGNQQYYHAGYEVGYIIKGELTVVLEDNEYVLHQGDSISYKSMRPHMLKNHSTHVTVAIWVNLVPWIFAK